MCRGAVARARWAVTCCSVTLRGGAGGDTKNPLVDLPVLVAVVLLRSVLSLRGYLYLDDFAFDTGRPRRLRHRVPTAFLRRPTSIQWG